MTKFKNETNDPSRLEHCFKRNKKFKKKIKIKQNSRTIALIGVCDNLYAYIFDLSNFTQTEGYNNT